MNDAGGLVDHILEVDTVFFFQRLLIFEITKPADIEEKLCAHILGLRSELIELALVVALSLEILNKVAQEHRQASNVFALCGLYNHLEHLLVRTLNQIKPFGNQLLFQMDQHVAPIIVSREGISQVRFMFAMKSNLIIDALLVLCQFLFGV